MWKQRTEKRAKEREADEAEEEEMGEMVGGNASMNSAKSGSGGGGKQLFKRGGTMRFGQATEIKIKITVNSQFS
jgi:hypothetical protein